MEIIAELAVERLLAANAECSPSVTEVYDEVLEQVVHRIRESGVVGKLDIGALVFWKRLNASTRWVRKLLDTPDDEVCQITRKVVAVANDRTLQVPVAAATARGLLSPLPGFSRGDAVASAVIHAAAPERMAVYDRRAQRGLECLGLTLTAGQGRYGRYMQHVENLRSVVERTSGVSLTARDVDLALFWLGR